MKIKHWMTANPITVTPETLIIDARKIMKDHQIRRLPVLDENGKLVGIVTYRNIIEASPSAATSLSMYELNYLIMRLKVADVMKKNPIFCSPDDFVIDVMLMGHQKKIGCLPVLEDGRLVGILTQTDVFNAMIQIFGTRKESEIITLVDVPHEDSVGIFRQITEVIEKLRIPVLAIFSLPMRDLGTIQIYVRVRTKEIKAVIDALTNAGFTVGD